MAENLGWVWKERKRVLYRDFKKVKEESIYVLSFGILDSKWENSNKALVRERGHGAWKRSLMV